jgi:predicted RNA-binding protein associated with RNAse of E/G family
MQDHYVDIAMLLELEIEILFIDDFSVRENINGLL